VHSQEVDEYAAPNGCFVGEPVFVPRRGPTTLEALHEDHIHNADTSSDYTSNLSSGGDTASRQSEGNVVVFGRASDSGKSYRMRLNGNGQTAQESDDSPVTSSMAAVQQRNHEDDGYLITPM
jgi:hypothetical protein